MAFAVEVVYGLPFALNRARVALATYSDDVNVAFNLRRYSTQRDVLNAISFSQHGGRTNTAAALREARDKLFVEAAGDRQGVDNVVILVTDGQSNVGSRADTIRAAERLRDDGVSVVVIALGEEVDSAEINAIASDNRVFNVRQASDVVPTARRVLDRLCNW